MENILREVLLDHVKSPKNRGEIEHATISANSNNPVCGDVVKVDLLIENGVVTEVQTSGEGCAVSQASMSIFSEEISNNSIEDVALKIKEFKSLFEQESSNINELSEQSRLLKFLDNNPSKVRCAMLSWLAVEESLAS